MKNAKFSISKIIKLLKEQKLIIDDENELKEYLMSFSSERIINNYSQPFMKNFDLNKKEYNQKDSSKSIIELFNYDKDMSSLLFNSIKDIESTFGYKILYFINRKINDLSLEQNEYEKIFFAIFDEDISKEIILSLNKHFNCQVDYKSVVIWVYSNDLTFGERLWIFEHLNNELQYMIILSYKNINWNIKQFFSYFLGIEIIKEHVCS